MWLLRATGGPHRKIKIENDPITGEDVVRPASTFHFPACEPCNQKYGKTLEKHAKKAIESLLTGKSLGCRSATGYWIGSTRCALASGSDTTCCTKGSSHRSSGSTSAKDRIAIISVDPSDLTKGFGFSGLDNQIFRTSQAGMFFKINNIRILSLSFDGLISRFAGMPFPKEMLALSDDPDRHIAVMGRTDYRIEQDWREFQIPGATVIAQASFWWGNCVDDESFAM
jgi:hypothetical protein